MNSRGNEISEAKNKVGGMGSAGEGSAARHDRTHTEPEGMGSRMILRRQQDYVDAEQKEGAYLQKLTMGHEQGNTDIRTEDFEGHMDTQRDFEGQQPGLQRGESDILLSEPAEEVGYRKLSRKRTRQGRYVSDITLEEVMQYMHLPTHVACEKLGLGLTSFKRMCRGLGIAAWPYKASGPRTRSASDANGSSQQGMPVPAQFQSNRTINAKQQPMPPHPVSHSMAAEYVLNATYDSDGQAKHHPGMGGNEYMVSGSAFAVAKRSQSQDFKTGQNHLQKAELVRGRDMSPDMAQKLRAELIRIYQFSAEMKRDVGFTIIRDDIVQVLLEACTNGGK